MIEILTLTVMYINILQILIDLQYGKETMFCALLCTVFVTFVSYSVRKKTTNDLSSVVDKSRNMEHPGTFRNIPEHRIIMIIMRKD